MNKEEFERLKAEEKAHLRKLRALKQQHREATRKKGLLDALRGLTNPEVADTHDEMLDRVTRDNVTSEARFEVAMEDAGLDDDSVARAVQEEADREATQKAEAEALVRQMKSEIPARKGPPDAPANTPGDTPTAPSAPGRAEGRTIGRAAPHEDPGVESASDDDAKTIGRRRRDG